MLIRGGYFDCYGCEGDINFWGTTNMKNYDEETYGERVAETYDEWYQEYKVKKHISIYGKA